MNILLIKPKWFFPGGAYKFSFMQRLAPLNLGILAALSNHETVRIIDEDIEPIPEAVSADLVGISAATFTAPQAYQIAQAFRRRGARVVLGGVHPSLMPQECLRFCDAVAVGEAEYLWPEIVNDARQRRLKPLYKSEGTTRMEDVPLPRRDLFSDKYIFQPVQATRGCVHACRFCYLNEVPWGTHRLRNIPDVIRELRQIKSRFVFFVDDNLFVNHDYALDLMERMRPLNLIWVGQAPVSVAKNDGLLKKMAAAGCLGLGLGFQSVNQGALDANGVWQQAAEYKETVARLHRHGILVQGFFMMGFDADTEESLRRTFDVIRDIDLDDVLFYILTPYPGTGLFRDLEGSRRILSRDLSKYSWNHCVFQPKNMEPRTLEALLREGYDRAGRFQQRAALRKVATNAKWFFKSPRIFFHFLNGSFRGVDPSMLP